MADRWKDPLEQNLRIDRPRLYEKMKANGELEEYLEQTARMAAQTARDLSRKGMDPFQAESEAMRMFLLSGEEDMANLGESGGDV